MFEVCGFHVWLLLGFFFLHINLQRVSLLWEGAEPLQSLSGLAAIHPETLGTSQARVGISCKSNTSGKGCALHNPRWSRLGDPTSFHGAWKCCCKLFSLVILITQKCRVMLTENLYQIQGNFYLFFSMKEICKQGLDRNLENVVGLGF